MYRYESIKLMLAGPRAATSTPIHTLRADNTDFAITALGSAILFTYPNIAAIAGVQGLLVYALSSGLPLLIFAALGPIIRRKCPDGFVLTQWTLERYGLITSLYLSFFRFVLEPPRLRRERANDELVAQLFGSTWSPSSQHYSKSSTSSPA